MQTVRAAVCGTGTEERHETAKPVIAARGNCGNSSTSLLRNAHHRAEAFCQAGPYARPNGRGYRHRITATPPIARLPAAPGNERPTQRAAGTAG